jgi:hypothetical protein
MWGNTDHPMKLVWVIRITTAEMAVIISPISLLLFLLLLGINKIHHFVAHSVDYGTWEYLRGSNEALPQNTLHIHTTLHQFLKLKNEVGVIRISQAKQVG